MTLDYAMSLMISAVGGGLACGLIAALAYNQIHK